MSKMSPTRSFIICNSSTVWYTLIPRSACTNISTFWALSLVPTGIHSLFSPSYMSHHNFAKLCTKLGEINRLGGFCTNLCNKFVKPSHYQQQPMQLKVGSNSSSSFAAIKRFPHDFAKKNRSMSRWSWNLTQWLI